MDGLGQDVPATMKKPILHSKLTHARRPRVRPYGPRHSLREFLSKTATCLRRFSKFKIQHSPSLSPSLSPPRPFATFAALR